MAGTQWRYDGTRWAEHEWAQTEVLFAAAPDWRDLAWAQQNDLYGRLVQPLLDDLYRDHVAPQLESRGIDPGRYSLALDKPPTRRTTWFDVSAVEIAVEDMIRRRQAIQRLWKGLDLPPEILTMISPEYFSAIWPDVARAVRCATEVMWCSGDWNAVSDMDGIREDGTDEPHRGGDP